MTEDTDAAFTERFNSFIQTANGYLTTTQPAHVSISLNEAAARYHAWVWAKTAPSPEAFAAKKADATAYFLDQCRKMFETHYDEYIATYEHAFPKQTTPES